MRVRERAAPFTGEMRSISGTDTHSGNEPHPINRDHFVPNAPRKDRVNPSLTTLPLTKGEVAGRSEAGGGLTAAPPRGTKPSRAEPDTDGRVRHEGAHTMIRRAFTPLLNSKYCECIKAPLKSPSANESRWGGRGEDSVLHPEYAVPPQGHR